MPPIEARKELANRLSLAAGTRTGLTTAALSGPAGAMFGKMLGGETGKTLLHSMGSRQPWKHWMKHPKAAVNTSFPSGNSSVPMQALTLCMALSMRRWRAGLLGAMGGGMGGFGHAAGTRMRARRHSVTTMMLWRQNMLMVLRR